VQGVLHRVRNDPRQLFLIFPIKSFLSIPFVKSRDYLLLTTMFLDISYSGWAIGIFASLLVGLGKGGLPGTGNLSVILMAMIFPSKESVGVLLPILICADIVAVLVYHQHTRWKQLLKLLPWTLTGIGIGAFVFKQVDDTLLTRMIGAILLLMVALRFMLHFFPENEDGRIFRTKTGKHIFVGLTGILGGVATMVANAAGPIVAIYLLVSGLPKYAFIGTSAWFFFLINLSKMPVQVSLGNITWHSLRISMIFGIFAVVAAMIAPKIVHYLPQKVFSFLIWTFVVVAGLKMLFL
jgi:uncharacterized protein